MQNQLEPPSTLSVSARLNRSRPSLVSCKRSEQWQRLQQMRSRDNHRHAVGVSGHSSQSHGPQSVVRSYPTYKEPHPATLPNPTDRSPWFVHTQPTKNRTPPLFPIPRTAVRGSFIPNLQRTAPRHSSQSHGPQSVVRSYPTYKATGIF